MRMLGIAGLMAGSVALVACTKPAPPANPPPVEMAKPKPMTGIPTDCGNFTSTGTYTMKVNSALHVTGRTGPNGRPYANLKPKQQTYPPGQLDTAISLNVGESAYIEIDLTGQEQFNILPDGTTMNLKAGQPPIFCGAKLSDGNQKLTFTTFRTADSQTYSAYSLAVVLPDNGNWKPGDPALFAIIDPIVENDGYSTTKYKQK
jgi:hypothetical protein